MFRGYFRLGGTEIVNSERTEAYVKHELPGFGLRDCLDCDTLHGALGDTAYESPLVDDAPWLDESNPATQGFYGFFPLELSGSLDDTREVAVTEGILDGGFVGQPRHASREMRYRGMLIARDRLALHAGMTWLKAALDPAPCADHGGSCTGAVACMYAACPDYEICYEEDPSVVGASVPTGSISPSTPFERILPADALIQGYFVFPATDGLVLQGSVGKSTFGPIVSKRTNAVPNPSFTKDISGWLYGGRTLVRNPTGGADGGPYASAMLPELAVNGNFETAGAPLVVSRNFDPNPSMVAGVTQTLRTNLSGNPTGNLVATPSQTVGVTDQKFFGNGPGTGTRTWYTGMGDGPAGITSYRRKQWTVTPTSASDVGMTFHNGGVASTRPVVVPGTNYALSFWTRTTLRASGGGISRLEIKFWASDGTTQIGSTVTQGVTTADSDWHLNTIVLTAPVGAAQVTLQWSLNLPAASLPQPGDYIDITGVLWETTSTVLPFFDGATPSTGDYTYAWTGTAEQSSSTMKANTVTGWTPDAGTTQTQSTEHPYVGTTSLHLVAAADNTIVRSVGQSFVPVAGQPYTISAYVWVPTATPAVVLTVSGGGTATVTSPLNTVLNAWTRVQATIVPATTDPVSYAIATNSVAAGGVGFFIDAMQAEPGDTASPYFDGSSSSTGQDVTYAWTGTANASASTRTAVTVANVSQPTPNTAQVIQSSKWSVSPSKSVRIVPDALSNDSYAVIPISSLGLVSGSRYSVSATIHLDAPQTGTLSDLARTIVYHSTTAGDVAGIVADNAAGDTAVSLRFTYDGTGEIRLYNGAASGGGDVWYDNLSLGGEVAGSIRTPDLDAPFGPIEASFDLRGVAGTIVTAVVVTVNDNTVLRATPIVLTGKWQRFYTQADYGRRVYVAFESTGAFDVDRVMVEAGHNGLPYFDGSTPAYDPYHLARPYGSYSIAWTGAPDASSSVMLWSSGSTYPHNPGEQVIELDPLCPPDQTVTLESLAGTLPAGVFYYDARMAISAEDQAIPYERNFHDVTVTAGPTIVNEYSFKTGSAVEVEFTMVAGTPFAYGTTDDIIIRQNMSTLPTSSWVDVACPLPDVSPIIDPNCLPLPAPPRPPAVPNVCVTTPTLWQRYSLVIPGDKVSGWSQMLPTIVLNTKSVDVRSVRVRFTPNPFGWPTASTTRMNRATNPGLYANATGWSALGTLGTPLRVDNGASTQSFYQVTATAAHAAQLFGPLTTLAGYNLVTAGRYVNMSIDAKDSLAKSLQLKYQFYDAANATVGAAGYGTAVPLAANTFGSLQALGVLVPTNAVRVAIAAVQTGAATTGEIITATRVMIQQNSAVTTYNGYFDGYTKAANATYYNWEGTPGNSQSVAVTTAVDPCGYCSEFILSYLPANAELTVDGLTHAAYASISGGPAKPASHLLYGTNGIPMSWPQLSCGIPYIMTVDVPPTDVANVTVSLSLTRQES